jgi:multidrug efflux pump subunit AcrA (membrane-fusion protein)
MVESSALSREARAQPMPDRFDAIERQLENLSAAVATSDAVDQKFATVNQRFDAVGQRFDGLSRKVDVLHEATQQDIRLLAELIGATSERMDRGFAELRADIHERTAFLEIVMQSESKAVGELRQTDADHERRIIALEADS